MKNKDIANFEKNMLKYKNTAKEIAMGRHRFLEEFLNEFHDEWNGVK